MPKKPQNQQKELQPSNFKQISPTAVLSKETSATANVQDTQTETGGADVTETVYPYHFFICHDEAIRGDVVFPLLAMFRYFCDANVVFCDYDSLQPPSDSIFSQEIAPSLETELSKSRFGMVIFSKDFFRCDQALSAARFFNERHKSTKMQGIIPIFYQLKPYQCYDLQVESYLKKDTLISRTDLNASSSEMTSVIITNRKGFSNIDHSQLKTLIKLPKEWTVGKAVDDGGCFFDALAQALNRIQNTNQYGEKTLRLICHDYYLKHSEIVNAWNKTDYGSSYKGDDYSFVQYTTEDLNKLFHGRPPIWGRPHIEGRMLCEVLKLKELRVIEIMQDPETQQPVLGHIRIDQNGSKPVPDEDSNYEDAVPRLIVSQQVLHFVPVLQPHTDPYKQLANELASFSGYEHDQKQSDKNFWISVVSDLLLSRFKEQYGLKLRPEFQRDYHVAEARNQLVDKLSDIYQIAQGYYAAHPQPLSRGFVDQLMSYLSTRERFEEAGAIAIPAQNPHFVGRIALLETLQQRLEQHAIVALVNGNTEKPDWSESKRLGKTELAVEFAHRQYQQGNYEFVYYLKADNEKTLKNGLLALAKKLKPLQKLDFPSESKVTVTPELVQQVYQMLSSSRCLLIFDNAKDQSTIKTDLPLLNCLSQQQHILITSRSAEWEHTLAVDAFTAEEAKLLIQKRLSAFLSTEEEENLKRRLFAELGDFLSNEDAKIEFQQILSSKTCAMLAKTLGYLPTALNHAVTYMQQMKISQATYLVLYERYGHSLLEEPLIQNEEDIENKKNLQKQGTTYTPVPALKTSGTAASSDFISRAQAEQLTYSILSENKLHKPTVNNNTTYRYGFFICHRGTIKCNVAFPLLAMLRYTCGSDIAFYDQVHMPMGYKGEETIETSLTNSRVGLIILSEDFFMSDYTTFDEAEKFIKRHETKEDTVVRIFYELTPKQCKNLPDNLCQNAKGEDADGIKQTREHIAEKQAIARKLGSLDSVCYLKNPHHQSQEAITAFWVEVAFDLITQKVVRYNLSLLPEFRHDYTKEPAKTQLKEALRNVYQQAVAYHEEHQKLSDERFERFFANLKAWEVFNTNEVTQLPFRNSHFVGRVETLKTLWQQLNNDSPITALTEDVRAKKKQQMTLHGIGGGGKTQIALEFAHRHHQRGDYQIVRWLSADSTDALRAAFLDMADKFKLVIQDLTMEQIIRRVYRKLSSWQWLLVFDNVKDQSSIQTYLPELDSLKSQQHILVTSRNEQWSQKIAVHVFSSQEAVNFIQQELEGETTDDESYDQLAETLGYLPLALNQAVAYIRQNRIHTSDYLKKYEVMGVSLLEEAVPRYECMGMLSYEKTVLTTYQLAFEKINDNLLAVSVLLTCALLHGDEIPLSVLSVSPVAFRESTVDLLKAIKLLRNYSLLIGVRDNTFSLHPLLQSIIIKKEFQNEETQKLQIQRLLGLMDTFGVMLNSIDTVRKDIKAFIKFDLHTQSLVRCYDQIAAFNQILLDNIAFANPELNNATRSSTVIFAYLLAGMGVFKKVAGDAACAKTLLERSLEIEEKLYGKDHSSVVATLINLATTLLDFGDFSSAKTMLERALKIQEAHFGKDHPNVAVILVNLGGALNALGDLTNAKIMLEWALKVEEAHFDGDHFNMAMILINLSNVLGDFGDFSGQKSLLERALKIQVAYFGKNHPEVANTLANLGTALFDLGDAAGAKTVLERALKIQETNFGKDHPSTVQVLANLSTSWIDLGKPAEAKVLLEHALEICEAHYGKDHPITASVLANLDPVLIAFGGEYDANRKIFLERALKIQEANFGKDSFLLTSTLDCLGNACGALGDTVGKRIILERSLKIKEAHYGKDHPKVAITLTNLGEALNSLGKSTDAKILLQRALEINEKHYGREHLNIVVTLTNLSNVFKNLGDMHDAKTILERALKIQEAYYDKDHPKIAETLANLGMVEMLLYSFERSEQFLNLAHHIFTKNSLPDRFRTAEMLKDLQLFKNMWPLLSQNDKSLLNSMVGLLKENLNINVVIKNADFEIWQAFGSALRKCCEDHDTRVSMLLLKCSAFRNLLTKNVFNKWLPSSSQNLLISGDEVAIANFNSYDDHEMFINPQLNGNGTPVNQATEGDAALLEEALADLQLACKAPVNQTTEHNDILLEEALADLQLGCDVPVNQEVKDSGTFLRMNCELGSYEASAQFTGMDASLTQFTSSSGLVPVRFFAGPSKSAVRFDTNCVPVSVQLGAYEGITSSEPIINQGFFARIKKGTKSSVKQFKEDMKNTFKK